MSDILSQNEIDELLKALNSGELNVNEIEGKNTTQKVKKYDFMRQNKFLKEQLRTIRVIYENYSRLMSSYMSGILRTYCQVDVVSVEEQTYYEFDNSLPDPVIIGIISFAPLEGSILMEFSPSIAYAMVDRLLGGPGNSIEQIREFTEIELVLVQRIIRQLLVQLKDSWANVIQIDPVIQKIETNSQFAQIVSSNESVAIVTLNVKIGKVDGMVNFCIPHVVVEPILKNLNTKFWFQTKDTKKNEQDKADIIKNKLDTTPVEMTAYFDGTKFSIKDILGLQIGDVIQFDHKVYEDVFVNVGSVTKFKGALGVRNKKLSVKITDVIREEDKEKNE